MQLRELNGAHLTYCTNVHPGESLADVERALAEPVLAVKARVSQEEPFGVGLRLAARAAFELEAPGRLEQFAEQLRARDLYCFTINGFPYGTFHGTRVKEQVYLPDWLDAERVRYTCSLAHSLSRLLPDGLQGSISTVPGCFRPVLEREAGAAPRMARAMIEVVSELVRIERDTGKHIALALEPEPHCFLETSQEAVCFFESELFNKQAAQILAGLSGLSAAQAEAAVRSHLGVCLDTCHASVEFESPLEALGSLRRAGIAIPKVQISAGLRVPQLSQGALRALGGFAETVYLHQTVVKSARGLTRYVDLPEALAAAAAGRAVAPDEWRVHFHVPIFERELGPFESTQQDLLPLLAALGQDALCPHLEVETYTWDVLPEKLRELPLTEAIARELVFARRALAGHAVETTS